MKERHIGIDLLRILSMFLVLVLHIIGQGGILAGLDPLSLRFKAVWFLEIAAYCSVNCYALVTGYVSVYAKFKYSRIIALWFQVLFYTLLITLCFKIFMPGALWEGLITAALLPVTKVQYWYFTAYFGMFFFIPYFNRLIHTLDRAQFKLLITAFIILFSVLPTLFQADLFSISSGYSMLWLVLLYFIGAYFKLYGVERRGGALYFSGFAFFVIITWCTKFLPLPLPYNRNMFISYTSPLIVGSAVSLFLFCLHIKKVGKFTSFLIKMLNPASFGVYLIHTHPLVWMLLLRGRFAGYATMGTLKLVLTVVFTAASIYLACSLVDILRAWFFKLIRIGLLSEKLEQLFASVIRKSILRDKELSAAGKD